MGDLPVKITKNPSYYTWLPNFVRKIFSQLSVLIVWLFTPPRVYTTVLVSLLTLSGYWASNNLMLIPKQQVSLTPLSANMSQRPAPPIYQIPTPSQPPNQSPGPGSLQVRVEHPFPNTPNQYRCVFENGTTRPVRAGEMGTGWCK